MLPPISDYLTRTRKNLSQSFEFRGCPSWNWFCQSWHAFSHCLDFSFAYPCQQNIRVWALNACDLAFMLSNIRDAQKVATLFQKKYFMVCQTPEKYIADCFESVFSSPKKGKKATQLLREKAVLRMRKSTSGTSASLRSKASIILRQLAVLERWELRTGWN